MSMREAPLPRFLNRSLETVFAAICLSFVATLGADAGSATWNSNPATSDWNTATNWTPQSVPNGPADTATFAGANRKNVNISSGIEVTGIVFNAGASAFTFTQSNEVDITLSGSGITNNSGVSQSFAPFYNTTIAFTNAATAVSFFRLLVIRTLDCPSVRIDWCQSF